MTEEKKVRKKTKKKDGRANNKPLPNPAPLGNQYAKGNKGGAPRKWDPQEQADLLLEFAAKEDSLILREFAWIQGYDQDYMIRMANEFPVFRQAYERARVIIGVRREKLMIANAMHSMPYSKYASVYDTHLKKHEIEMSEKGVTSSPPMKIEITKYSEK